MEAPIQTDQHRFIAAKIIDGYRAISGNCVQHEIGRSFATLQWANIGTVRHLVSSRKWICVAIDARSLAHAKI